MYKMCYHIRIVQRNIHTTSLNVMKNHSFQTQELFHTIIRCPKCVNGTFTWHKEIVKCQTCHSWYPIVDGTPELLTEASSYKEDRTKIWNAIGKKYHLKKDPEVTNLQTPQVIQQQHFDSYATDIIQSYDTYELMPFWRVVDHIIFERWHTLLPKHAVILDIGCAQGRSIAQFVKDNYTVIGFDVSKNMITAGVRRFKRSQNPPILFLGDASSIPIADRSIDVVIVYGVLHHLPKPQKIVREIERILKPDGIFLSLENNKTPLRFCFDLLQKYYCLWDEKAGESPTMSKKQIKQWFSSAHMSVQTRTHVYIPPHLINILPYRVGYTLTRWIDTLLSKIPVLRSWGGLIEIVGKKEVRT
jgi:ubiquinone/menaquinone biosynthesis C-methylase UbiE/uncharacterized protein YbaR (Trm112 family)